jgi:hypothetical protein
MFYKNCFKFAVFQYFFDGKYLLRRHLKSLLLEDSLNFTNRVFIKFIKNSHKPLETKSGSSSQNINC